MHQIALLEPGVGRRGAGLAVAMITFMALAGRFCLGIVADRFDPRLADALSFVRQALALLIILEAGQAPVCWSPAPSSAFRSATS